MGKNGNNAERAVYNDEMVFQLGDRSFSVPELSIKRCRKWQKKVNDIQKEMMQSVGGLDESDPDSVLRVFEILLIENQERFIELIYDYSEKLNKDREWIEDNATTRQCFAVIKELINVSFPFAYGSQHLTPVAVKKN